MMLQNSLTYAYKLESQQSTLAEGTKLYHGAAGRGAEAIKSRGINLELGNGALRRGFYTTTLRALADAYAAANVGKTSLLLVNKDVCLIKIEEHIQEPDAIRNAPINVLYVSELRNTLSPLRLDCLISRDNVPGPAGGDVRGPEFLFWTESQKSKLSVQGFSFMLI